jgi:hypothetical protein
MSNLWENLPSILKSVPENPIPISLLAITILAALGYFLFNKDRSNYRLAVFFAVFFGVILLLLLLLFSAGKIVPVSLYKIPTDSRFFSFVVQTELDNLTQCQSRSRSALESAGYDPKDIKVGGSSIFGGNYFNTREGIGTAIWCVNTQPYDKQKMYGFTYGFDVNLLRETHSKLYSFLSNSSDTPFMKNYGDLTSAYFQARSSELFIENVETGCLTRAGEKLKVLGLPNYKQGGSVLYVPIQEGTFAVGCRQFSHEIPNDDDDKPQFLFAIQYFAFGNSSEKVDDIITRFGNSIADLPTDKLSEAN